MVYKRYYSPFEEKSANTYLDRHTISTPTNETKDVPPPKPAETPPSSSPFGFLNKIGTDDLILIGILLILLMENKEQRDIPMILAVAFLFLIQYIEAE